MPGFNVWGMGGFATVPPPHVGSPGCSEASPPETASAQRWCGETRNRSPETALRPLRQQSCHRDIIPGPPPLHHVARHAVLPHSRCATMYRYIIIPVSVHITRLYPGPADDVVAGKRQKRICAKFFVKNTKSDHFRSFSLEGLAALFCCSHQFASRFQISSIRTAPPANSKSVLALQSSQPPSALANPGICQIQPSCPCSSRSLQFVFFLLTKLPTKLLNLMVLSYKCWPKKGTPCLR